MALCDPASLSRDWRQKGELPSGTIQRFQQLIYEYHHATPRPMPWRDTRDPYHILVSEIMLQQTQVSRVQQKYRQFLSTFPTIHRLASAPLPELLTVWQGLGYNRRALMLKRCAELIVAEHGGVFPSTVASLQQLPGIGAYTSRAVAAFAFGIATPFIETNIRTVFIHFFFDSRDDVHDREIMPLVELMLDRHDPRQWYYALMDYGAMLKQQLPNPGRRSRHHSRQSPFEGSNRQLRSVILKTLLDKPAMTGKMLAETVQRDEAAIVRNLDAMVLEGFLQRSGARYGIANDTKKGDAA